MAIQIHMTGLDRINDNAQAIVGLTGNLKPFSVTTSQVDEYIETVETCLKHMQDGLRMVREFNLYLGL